MIYDKDSELGIVETILQCIRMAHEHGMKIEVDKSLKLKLDLPDTESMNPVYECEHAEELFTFLQGYSMARKNFGTSQIRK